MRFYNPAVPGDLLATPSKSDFGNRTNINIDPFKFAPQSERTVGSSSQADTNFRIWGSVPEFGKLETEQARSTCTLVPCTF